MRGDARKIEHRGREAGIFEVDQPQPFAVVEEIRGQQVVVAEYDGQRGLHLFELVADRDELVQPVAAETSLNQCSGIVADDVKDPEHEARTADMVRHFRVETADRRRDASDVGAHILRPECAALDEAGNHDARFGMDDLGRETGLVRGARHHDLAFPEDVMKREVAAEAHDEFLSAVLHREAFVAQPAGQRPGLDPAAPQRQRIDAFSRVRRLSVHAPRPGPWRVGWATPNMCRGL